MVLLVVLYRTVGSYCPCFFTHRLVARIAAAKRPAQTSNTRAVQAASRRLRGGRATGARRSYGGSTIVDDNTRTRIGNGARLRGWGYGLPSLKLTLELTTSPIGTQNHDQGRARGAGAVRGTIKF